MEETRILGVGLVATFECPKMRDHGSPDLSGGLLTLIYKDVTMVIRTTLCSSAT